MVFIVRSGRLSFSPEGASGPQLQATATPNLLEGPWLIISKSLNNLLTSLHTVHTVCLWASYWGEGSVFFFQYFGKGVYCPRNLQLKEFGGEDRSLISYSRL